MSQPPNAAVKMLFESGAIKQHLNRSVSQFRLLYDRRGGVLDQIRTADKTRLVKRLGRIDKQAQTEVLSIMDEMFAP